MCKKDDEGNVNVNVSMSGSKDLDTGTACNWASGINRKAIRLGLSKRRTNERTDRRGSPSSMARVEASIRPGYRTY